MTDEVRKKFLELFQEHPPGYVPPPPPPDLTKRLVALMRQVKDMQTIEIYPKTPKPDWLKVGCSCYVWGEGNTQFRVEEIDEKYSRAYLMFGKYDQGYEPFDKLHQHPNS